MDNTEAGGIAEVVGRSEHAETSRPAITPTLVVGLGGTGTSAIRCLKRRLVWLWHRNDIERDLDRRPDDVDPTVWQEEIWRRYEVAGGPPSIQLLAVDTLPWMNRAGQVYLCRHEYVYLGGYNATAVLRHLRDHPEICDWWGWETSRPGQIHSGARQIRAIGRLSLYRRYREFWSQLRPKIDKICSIDARQMTEDKEYPVAPSGATKRAYVITSICGGTGAGVYLDVAARLRSHFLENAIITGIFALPSVFLAELQSELQQERIQANAYAALKEINHYQSHAFEQWLPGEERVSVEPLFNRLYLVERQNKAGESLNSINDVCQLIANQVFLESMTDVGSRVWEYDVNVTMERRQKGERTMSYVFSSFANSSLLVPRDQILNYCELRYAEELISSGISRELTADEHNDLNAKAQTVLGTVEQLVASALGASGGLLEEPGSEGEELLQESEGAAASHPQTPAVSASGPLEQLMQDENRAVQAYGLNGGLYLAQLLTKGLTKRLENCRQQQSQQSAEVSRVEEELQNALIHRPWYVRWNVPPISFFTRAARQAYEHRVNALRNSRDTARGQLADLSRKSEQWMHLQATMAPLEGQFKARRELLSRVSKERIRLEIDRLFKGSKVVEQQPYEMLRMVLTQEYIAQTVWPEVGRECLAMRRPHDTARLLAKPCVSQVRVVTSTITQAGTLQHLSTLALVPCDLEPLMRLIRQVARQATSEAIPEDRLHIRRFLEDPRFAIQSRLRDFFNRCEPFWSYDLDLGGLSESYLEKVVLAGVRDANDPAWGYLLRDFTDFTLVDTDDPTRIDACRIEHGLPINYLKVLQELKNRYDEFYRQDAGPMHLDKRWEPDGTAALPELIGNPPRRDEKGPVMPDSGSNGGAPTSSKLPAAPGPHAADSKAGPGGTPPPSGAPPERSAIDKGVPIADETSGAGGAPAPGPKGGSDAPKPGPSAESWA